MGDTKRQYLPTQAGLWVVATPIGNLGDLTERARLALESASAVLCEDTRRTSRLMAAIGISPRLERFDAHSGERQIEALVKRLEAGESLALVTDAGTPGISDPGSRLVAAAWSAGISVTPFPGPSAVTALLSVAGVSESAFGFRGFFPRKSGERGEEIKLASASELFRAYVWYESPERIAESISFLAERAPDAYVAAAKELTKVHERFFVGNANEVAHEIGSEIEREGAVGEWCFCVVFPKKSNDLPSMESAWGKALQCLLNEEVAPSRAAKQVSQIFGVNKNEVYDLALELSGKKRSNGA